MINLGSFCRGIKAANRGEMLKRWSLALLGPNRPDVRRIAHRKFWLCLWTPVWHEGRGPYVSIGLYFFAIYRGY